MKRFVERWGWIHMLPVDGQARHASNGMLLALALQIGPGIATLLTAVALPLAVPHQAGAVVPIALALWATFALSIEQEGQGLSRKFIEQR